MKSLNAFNGSIYIDMDTKIMYLYKNNDWEIIQISFGRGPPYNNENNGQMYVDTDEMRLYCTDGPSAWDCVLGYVQLGMDNGLPTKQTMVNIRDEDSNRIFLRSSSSFYSSRPGYT